VRAGEATQERVASVAGDFWAMTGAAAAQGRLFAGLLQTGRSKIHHISRCRCRDGMALQEILPFRITSRRQGLAGRIGPAGSQGRVRPVSPWSAPFR
jgi:hypothetical protein